MRDLFVNFVRFLTEQHDLKFYRIGFVLRFSFLDNVDIGMLRRKYIRNDKLADIQDFQLAWVRRFHIENLEVNRLVRFAYNSMQQDGERSLIIDTNTLAEEEYAIDEHAAKMVVSRVQVDVREELEHAIEWD